MGCIDRKFFSAAKLALLSPILSLLLLSISETRGRSQQTIEPTFDRTISETRSVAGMGNVPLLWLPLLCGLGYGTIFWLRPRWLLGFDRRLRDIGLAAPFAYHPRVLDAWVEVHLQAIGQEFETRFESLFGLERPVSYIPRPVTLNGTSHIEFTGRDLRPFFDRSPRTISIVGKGGTGKTVLAAQIGRWATERDDRTRLNSHRMLPIWFDGETTHPIDTIAEQLEAAIGESLSRKLVEFLLRRGRILVVCDGMATMGDNILPRSAARVVTLPSIAGVENPNTCIELLPLRGYPLARFIEMYLESLQKHHLFDDEEFFEICHHLCDLAGDRSITPLYAQLYTDCAIADREKQSIDRGPENIPDLILNYLDRLNQGGLGDRHWPDLTLHRRAQVVAWECLQQNYRPVFIPEGEVLAALAKHDKPNPERAKTDLEYLIRDVGLLASVPTTGEVCFLQSPVARYLAGLYLVERNGEDEGAWREFLDRAKHSPATPEEIGDFLLAVRDCAIARQGETNLPPWLPERLGERAGLDPVLLRKAKLKHRIRELISQLGLPDTRLRQLAADRLGQLGARATAAVPTLVCALEDEDESVRIHASVALGHIGVEAVPALVNAFKKDNKEVRSGAAFALERMGNAAIPLLVEALKLEDSDVLSGTVFALERMGTAAIPALIEALKMGDDNVRVLTSIVLGRIGMPAVGDLVEAFQNGNATVRRHAANALGSMGAEASAAVPVFEGALLDRDKEVRSSAVFVLERIGAAAVPVLQQALAHEDWLVRRNAADALGRMGTQAKATIPDLENACADRDKYVREAAQEALRLIQGPNGG